MSTTEETYCHRPQVYLAAPLFNEGERTFNARVTELLEEFMEVYLPQRDGGLMSEMVAAGVPSAIAARSIFCRDLDAIQRAGYVIAILDGRTIDEGVAFELGVAFAQAKRCVGLQTDSRRLAMWGNNPMIVGALETVFESVDDLMEWVSTSVWMNRPNQARTGSQQQHAADFAMRRN